MVSRKTRSWRTLGLGIAVALLCPGKTWGQGNHILRVFEEEKQRVATLGLTPRIELDGGYVVSVPVLPGCVTQGDSRAEALRNAQEAIELYIEDCQENGDVLPVEAGREYVEIRVSA